MTQSVDMNLFLSLAKQTLRTPKDAARAVINLNYPNVVWWQVLALATVISGILYGIEVGAAAREAGRNTSDFAWLGGPLQATVVIAISALLTLWLIYFVGRMFGGTGSFSDTLAVVTWFHLLSTAVSVALAVFSFVIPSAIIGMASLAIMFVTFWVFISFIAAIHGFQNLFMVLVAFVATSAVMGFVISILLLTLGLIELPVMETPNV